MRRDAITSENPSRMGASSRRASQGSDRRIALDADAVGNMRRELIASFGWEATRGILARLGYNSGRHHARALRAHYSHASGEELLLAGLCIRRLEGMATVRITKSEIGRGNSDFQITGDWIDSCEAGQHLEHYGPGTCSVCWLLEGYTTGFASEILGKDVICMETRCRGKGDPMCGFELRWPNDWGDAALPMQERLAAASFVPHSDRCLRSIYADGCELEQTSLDAIFTTDEHGLITSCSTRGSELLGCLPGEAIGKEINSFYAGGASEFRYIMERLRGEGRIRNYLTEVLTPGGRRMPVALSASAIRNGHGEIVGTLAVAHDLAEIRRLEDELASKNRFIANILQDSAEAIITMDPNDVITFWNRGAEAIFGYSAPEVVGKSVSVLLPPELREAQELTKLRERMQIHGAVRSYQTERITKDGRRIQVIFTRTAIRDDSGKVIGSSAVLKDVTIFRNLERHLADAEHLATLGELSAGLAHEIKNPLAGIKGAIDVIRDSLASTDAHREILGDVLHEVNRMS